MEETIFPGSEMEMFSVYHIDRGSLLVTRYCMLGNQPQMKFSPRKSTARDFVFDFNGGTNLNPQRDMHMHSLRLTFPPKIKGGPQKLAVSGANWEGGKEKPMGCDMTLTRRQ